jgi:hypothetical protein
MSLGAPMQTRRNATVLLVLKSRRILYPVGCKYRRLRLRNRKPLFELLFSLMVLLGCAVATWLCMSYTF